MKSFNKIYEFLMNRVIWESKEDNYDVVKLSDIEDLWTELEYEVGNEIEEMRFLKYPRTEEVEIRFSRIYKFIPNIYTGGDNDYIILDIWKGEYTYGENGEYPLCDLDFLNDKYKDKTLEYIIKTMK